MHYPHSYLFMVLYSFLTIHCIKTKKVQFLLLLNKLCIVTVHVFHYSTVIVKNEGHYIDSLYTYQYCTASLPQQQLKHEHNATQISYIHV